MREAVLAHIRGLGKRASSPKKQKLRSCWCMVSCSLVLGGEHFCGDSGSTGCWNVKSHRMPRDLLTQKYPGPRLRDKSHHSSDPSSKPSTEQDVGLLLYLSYQAYQTPKLLLLLLLLRMQVTACSLQASPTRVHWPQRPRSLDRRGKTL